MSVPSDYSQKPFYPQEVDASINGTGKEMEIERLKAEITARNAANKEMNEMLALAKQKNAQLEEVIRGLLTWRAQSEQLKALNAYWDAAISLLPESQKPNGPGKGA